MTDRRLPLHEWHVSQGASFEASHSVLVPASYRDAERELAALDRVAVADSTYRSRLELVGEDRARFLNGQTTNAVVDIDPGKGVYTFFTDARARVLADGGVLGFEDRIWLDLPPGTQDSIQAQLEKYIVADRVEIRPLDDLGQMLFVGAEARTGLQELGADLEGLDAPFDHRRVSLRGLEGELVVRPFVGCPAFAFWISGALLQELAETCVASGVPLVGSDALEDVRIRGGVPVWGTDFGDGELPQETGLSEHGLDFEKGCYIGQEIVARLHYRGQAARQLCTVHFDEVQVAVGSSLLHDGREAGRLSSVVAHGGGCVGLALLRRAAVEAGSVVTEDGARGTCEAAAPKL